MCAQMALLTDYPSRFNRYFSKEGWLAHGSFDLTVMKRVVDEIETHGLDKATDILLEYYGPENLRARMFFLNGTQELNERRRFIDLAFEDYVAERYHAVVPILLMVMDGAVNDAVGKGLHAESLQLDVWDSVTTADGAINDIKAIFQKSRCKTRTETILFPYRNGILHGMDLGYDNRIVAAKCWCFLFIIADWIALKNSEEDRREKFAQETRVPSLRELAEKLARTQALKDVGKNWSAREILAEDLCALNRDHAPEEGTPEHTALCFLDLWRARNYGNMARLYWTADNPTSSHYAGEVRRQLSSIKVESYSVDRLVDEAPAITEMKVTINPGREFTVGCILRMVYENRDGEITARDFPDGTWHVMRVTTSELS